MSYKKRKYTNIKTIYEKAKAGELVDNKPSLFKKFEFNVRPEIIKPYLHQIDKSALLYSVRKYIENPNNYNEIINIARKDSKILAPDQLPNQIQNIWNKFPKEILNDIYNLHYNDIRNLKFEDRKKSNQARFTILEKTNDPIIKVITREDNINSMIYTRSIVQYYLAMLAITEQKDNQEFQKAMKSLQGENSSDEEDGNSNEDSEDENQSGEEESNSTDKSDQNRKGKGGLGNQAGEGNTDDRSLDKILETLQNRFENSSLGKGIESSIKKVAKDNIENINQLLSREEKESIWKNLSSNSYKEQEIAMNMTDSTYLSKMQSELNKVNLSMNGVKDKIKNLMDKSISYFSSKETIIHEDIFEASNLSGLEDYILLHPKFRKLFIHDIDIIDKKKIGKIDVYIDMSGSMLGSAGVQDKNGKNISKSLFAKSFLFKMKELDLINNIYSFEQSVKKRDNTQLSILSIDGRGGTNIDSVIENIRLMNNNAIVITDAEDSCTKYSDKAYFIGVSGANFSRFMKEYTTSDQLCIFNGKDIFKVDASGYQIN